MNGGDEEIRTPDPLLARQVLSQLSYTPMVLVVNIVFGKTFGTTRASIPTYLGKIFHKATT